MPVAQKTAEHQDRSSGVVDQMVRNTLKLDSSQPRKGLRGRFNNWWPCEMPFTEIQLQRPHIWLWKEVNRGDLSEILHPWSEKISSVFLQWVQVQIRILFSEVVYHISKDFRSYCSSHSFSWKAGLVFLRNIEKSHKKKMTFS